MTGMDNVNKANKWLMIACGIAVAISLGLAAYFYSQTLQLKQTPQKLSQERVSQVLEQLALIIVLPTDEEPTVAEVTDPALLQDHPFLAKAKKGDFIIVYTKAQKAYLFDAIARKIIDVGSVANQAETVANPTNQDPATVK